MPPLIDYSAFLQPPSPMPGPGPGQAIHTGWLNPGPQGPPVQPTSDTQDLYNKMRDAEATAADKKDGPHLDAANLARVAEHEAELKPPSPMEGDNSPSRQPSQRSHASSEARRRPRRKGPLHEYPKAKAAFFRKIGACAECRARRVGCHLDHRNLTSFENAYLVTKSRRRPLTPVPAMVPAPSPTASPANPLDQFLPMPDNSLFGIGINPGHQEGLEFQTMYPQSIPDDLMLDTTSAAELRPSVLPDPASTMQHVRTVMSPVGSPLLPIGKYLELPVPRWECQFGNLNNASHSAASSVSSTERCHQHCRNLDELRIHYMTTHLPFQDSDPQFMYHCSNCQAMNPDSTICVGCRASTPMVRFFYGFVSQSAVAFNLRGVPITAHRPNRANPSFLSPSSGTSNSAYSSSFGNHLGFGGTSHVSGGGQTGAWGHKIDNVPAASCGRQGTSCRKRSLSSVLDHDAMCRAYCRHWATWATVLLVLICLAPLKSPRTSQAASALFQRYTSTALAEWAATYMPLFAILCASAGVAMTWLFRHIRHRLDSGRAGPVGMRPERCLARDILGVDFGQQEDPWPIAAH